MSLTRLATYEPVEVRESAPKITPPSNSTAMIDVCICVERERERDKMKRREKEREREMNKVSQVKRGGKKSIYLFFPIYDLDERRGAPKKKINE